MKKILFLLSIMILLTSAVTFIPNSNAQDATCNNPSQLTDESIIRKCLDDSQKALDMSVGATKPFQSQLDSMQLQINGLKASLSNIQTDLNQKKKYIDQGYKSFAKQMEILNATIRDYYIKSYYNSPFVLFLSSHSASDFTQILGYQRAVADRDKAIITNIAITIQDLQVKKQQLEQQQAQLASLKTNLDGQSAKLDTIVKGALAYQSTLSSQIAQLSAKQQEIINARSGGFTATIGDSNQADDENASINGFRSNAPSGYFGVFAFGAYTHRNGMSQYGALGRFTSGKNTDAESILKFYYPNATLKKDYGVPSTITIDGYGQRQFEDEYMKRIYEMPGSWPSEVLRAQAVAARTYALRYTNNGTKSICADEGCQVYKDQNKGGSWDNAASDTKGWVLVDGGGNLISTQFSSTTGGWINNVGWDTNDGRGGANFIDKSYEKAAGSPWVYKAWYTQSYNINSDKCGRSNAWLSPEEMADIVNAAIALKTGGIDTSRITPVTTSCWGGNPYSMDELRNLVSGNGGISAATSISVSQGDGTTNNVTINGQSFSGSDFKKAFNLRAPGRLSIPQSGFAFYNIEKK
jgi:peptidoglycan hydrolase CwlO-like protein